MGRLTNIKPMVEMLKPRIKLPPKQAEPFYLSPTWRSFIARVIAKRGRRREECGATGCRIYGDHIVERRDGGADLDEKNILLRCHGCHERKGAKERAKRAHGRA
ncbi:HNH endonuclease [Aurantimonas sp. HBX-1]|uniref:HNH endonuclease n=1 Tax=Aurantimonas sp. HBX-1 TaxID=2906072 RepID=UPI001F16CE10|nr:HNH endonuclease [Aurantimonas sp. HBX-1]UIJ73382.1 HNH endonuclease [Aurantimonas sp. HBX-1]